MTRTARLVLPLSSNVRPKSLTCLTAASHGFLKLAGSPVPGGIDAVRFVGYNAPDNGGVRMAVYEADYPDARRP